jgi:ABC-type Zn2+ transport system substrate-binding protein/surface adhesin
VPDESGQLGPSYDATVMIDIGGDVGALIITTGESMHLAEIEISRADGLPHEHSHEHGEHEHSHEHSHRTHMAVRERHGPSGIRYAAIYPSLVEGEYEIWELDGTHVHATVQVVGGQISELDW